MAADLMQIVQRLKEKHGELARRYVEAIGQRDSALKRVADLEYTVRQQTRDIERLSQQVEFLTVVSTVMPDRDDVEKSRAVLSSLVREIDKCITDLTE